MSNIHVTDYWKMKKLVKEDFPFYAALAYLITKADSNNTAKLASIYPNEVRDMMRRHNLPAGAITEEEQALAQKMMDAGRMNAFGEVVDA